MTTQAKAQAALENMILSHSGWRGVFAASGEEEDGTAEIGAGYRTVVAGAAAAFAGFLQGLGSRPLVLIG